MSQNLINRYVATRIRVQKAIENSERGQGSLEYIGMIVVAAVLIVAVITAFTNGGFKQTITDKVNSVKTAISGFTG
jgi:uncharacterized protein (UPF0333 family)